jgi:asparagine synthase (glutamine-hydrolysing)
MVEELERRIIENCKKYEGLPIALSGGVDSGLLAALIKPKFAITVNIPQSKHNEIEEAKRVAKHLGIKHIIVDLDESKLDEYMEIAVKAIGRPIPHFNIFPLYVMYKTLAEMGETKLVLGDGPDEVMCGYARDLIINYLYKIYDFEAFNTYKPLIDKILPPINEIISKVVGYQTEETDISKADIKLMRPDMDDMSNGIASHFRILNLRPYQDNLELDNFMYSLPMEYKIQGEFGKYALRKIAEKYLPHDIAWRKKKMGGPLYNVNKAKNWDVEEFDKTKYLEYQKQWIK